MIPGAGFTSKSDPESIFPSLWDRLKGIVSIFGAVEWPHGAVRPPPVREITKGPARRDRRCGVVMAINKPLTRSFFRLDSSRYRASSD